MKSKYILCDHAACPLKDNCTRYLEGLDRTKTVHMATMPYNAKTNTCNFQSKFETDDLIEKVMNVIRTLNN